jgi:mono/diheme cytochrome c family protein
MLNFRTLLAITIGWTLSLTAAADLALLKSHCSNCHTGQRPKGDFSLHELGRTPTEESADHWTNSLDRVEAGDMPPSKHNQMTAQERARLIRFLRQQVMRYEESVAQPTHVPPRRMSNREFINSVRDVLQLEHVGSHDPTSTLLGDTLHEGFDTHGETLSLSEYHLDQYVTSVRRVLDGVILDGPRPESKTRRFLPKDFSVVDTQNRKRQDKTKRTERGVEVIGTQDEIHLPNFDKVATTGKYRIRIRARGVDHHVYDQEKTGIYDDDPIVLRIAMGAKHKDIQLPEEGFEEFVFDEWLVAGTPIRFRHHTDGLRMIGNGNFKFQNRIAHDYIKANKPALYQRVVTEEVPKAKFRSTSPSHWVHWVPYWEGPRPIIADAIIEGPIFESWPPQRHVQLLGEQPKASSAGQILLPLARRAWRRPVTFDELQPIVNLVESQAESLGDVGALKEGIVAILVSPSFLMVNPETSQPEWRFATKMSLFLDGTIPSNEMQQSVRNDKLNGFEEIRDELLARIESGNAEALLDAFPKGWLQLDRINFMAPDVDQYPLYEKKAISEDMVAEVLAFFRHCVTENRPVPELITADYSFVNADLAKVYNLEGVPDDSKLRRYQFTDGRRGGFLGMGAFLTLTADTLSTSPIHRAIYVMENFMGLHPAPPPADVEIREPDIRSARTIREVLAAHQSDASCAACHQAIDPFGYAFENFDPIGAWRDAYVDTKALAKAEASDANRAENANKKASRKAEARKQVISIPVDASASFISGAEYNDITEFRELMKSDVSQKRIVKCFVTKLLTFANGVEPDNYSEIDAIVKKSAEHDYRIVETIAAVIDSPLFREQ